MTTSNDISTPKKAETAPRQALELLADWIEAELAWIAAPMGSVAERNARDAVEPLHTALLSLDPVALRAQAEADKGLREATGRVVRKLEAAHKLAEVVNNQRPHGGNKLNMIDQLERIENATSMLRAALAQAGGES